MRSKASRWVLVGSVSTGTVTAVLVNRTWLRARVARCSSSPRKLRQGPARAVSRCREALAWAAAERRAGATGFSGAGGFSSVKVSGAHALRRCQVR